MTPLRLIVVGCGHMGTRHAEKVVELGRTDPGVALRGVADLDPEAAQRLAQRLGVAAARDPRQLVRGADAAIVAVPTASHFGEVRTMLEAGLDVLVEKPIASTLAEGEALLRCARQRGRILRVGHQEWFNPALRVVRERIRAPRFVEAHRLSSYSDRGTDTDVVRDLMIHDLDILQQLLGSPPERIEAIGVPVISPRVDIANARLVFPGGCIANLTASRVSVNAMRKIRFFQRDGYFSIDFLTQSVSIFRRRVDAEEAMPRVDVEELKIDPDDALSAQLRAFVDAVRTRSTSGLIGTDGVGALGTALRVIEAMPPVEALQ